MAIDARELDRRIRIERDAPASHDGLQNVSGSPEVLATVWAKKRAGGGGQRFVDAEAVATALTLFTIRWRSSFDPSVPGGLSPNDRVRYPAVDNGQLYDIARVDEVGRRDGLLIAATVRTDR